VHRAAGPPHAFSSAPGRVRSPRGPRSSSEAPSILLTRYHLCSTNNWRGVARASLAILTRAPVVTRDAGSLGGESNRRRLGEALRRFSAGY
jgi:hypothetical protein